MGEEIAIYALVDPRDDRVRYVGATGRLAARRGQHLGDARLGRARAKDRWLRGLLEIGSSPEVRVLERVPKGSAREAERRWIEHFRLAGAELTNSPLHPAPERPPPPPKPVVAAPARPMTPAELVAARTSLGLGQAALARALGMSTTAVWRWEKAERPIPPWLPLALRGLERERGAA
jgi:DNA-binding XRE family transcriptional regulator